MIDINEKMLDEIKDHNNWLDLIIMKMLSSKNIVKPDYEWAHRMLSRRLKIIKNEYGKTTST